MLLLSGNYDKVYLLDFKRKITRGEIETAIKEYGGTLTLPPDDEYDKIEVYDISKDEKYVDFDLWFDNVKSDLTLSCTFFLNNESCDYSIDNIHVL
ncbi:MAG: hypothetical protein HYZ42_17330 [Bacteroidetes bacterium]|nr:hypothetical protein [Bacteroidota bacterium]